MKIDMIDPASTTETIEVGENRRAKRWDKATTYETSIFRRLFVELIWI